MPGVSEALVEKRIGARYANLHKSFLSNVLLAVIVAFWTALFALPSYSRELNYSAFGQDFIPSNWSQFQLPSNWSTAGRGPKKITICEKWDFGRRKNIAPAGQRPVIVDFNASLGMWDDTNIDDIWCGWFPGYYSDFWSNLVQMIIFTVYHNAGETIQLAWQGIIGTLLAVVNAVTMEYIFPYGARTCECGDCHHNMSPCAPGETLLEDPGYNEAIVWLDVVGVIFAFLASKAEENTIKFGMCWHVYFMMDFMNPAKGAPGRKTTGWPIRHFPLESKYAAVLFTSVLGALLAVLATLIPMPLLNISWVYHDANKATKAIRDIWSDSIAYFCGRHATARRFEIEARIETTSCTLARIKHNLDMSWWETFDVGQYADVRALIAEFDCSVADAPLFLHALRSCIQDTDFSPSHGQFCALLQPRMEELKDEATDLMLVCAQTCQDGRVSPEERELIRGKVDVVRGKQAALLLAYKAANPVISQGFANEAIFVFNTSVMARKVTDFAEHIAELEQEKTLCGKSLAMGLFQAFKNTFNPYSMFTAEHMNFTVRNTLAITACYAIGHCERGWGDMFTEHDATMASTLSLLITHFTSSAWQKNLQRLLGVVLGKVLPILLLEGLAVIPCAWEGRIVFQFIAIILFVQMFLYVYYTSLRFSLVGCLIAAFGTPLLMEVCPLEVAQDASGKQSWLELLPHFRKKYMEIGQVTLAIVIQMAVDAIIQPYSPKQLACQKVQELGEHIQESLEAFFDNDLAGMMSSARDAQRSLNQAAGFVPECDPSLRVVPGWHSQFKVEVCEKALVEFQGLISDLSLLITAARDWVPLERTMGTAENDEEEEGSVILDIVTSRPSSQAVRDSLIGRVEDVMEALLAVITHDDEGPIDHPKLEKLKDSTGSFEFIGYDSFFSEAAAANLPSLRKLSEDQELLRENSTTSALSPGRDHNPEELTSELRARLLTVLRSLGTSWQRLGGIEEACLKAGSTYRL